MALSARSWRKSAAGPSAPTIAGDLLFYLKGFSNGQAGFYVVDLPSSVALAGDYNDDGSVDAADYVLWRRHVGAEAGTLPNDVDGGVIRAAQYETWRRILAGRRLARLAAAMSLLCPSRRPQC